MKRITIAVGLALCLAGCQPDFQQGDAVRATVGRTLGDPCLIAITIHSSPTSRAQSLAARLETPECRPK